MGVPVSLMALDFAWRPNPTEPGMMMMVTILFMVAATLKLAFSRV